MASTDTFLNVDLLKSWLAMHPEVEQYVNDKWMTRYSMSFESLNQWTQTWF